MALDPNIILQARGPQLDSPLKLATQAMTLKDLATKSRMQDQAFADQQALRDAYNSNVVTDETGTHVNSAGVLSSLGKSGHADLVPKMQQSIQKMDLANLQAHMQKAKMGIQLMGSANDQSSWSAALRKAEGMGLIKSGEIPEQYDPKLKHSLMMSELSAADQLGFEIKNRGLDIEEKKAKATEDLASARFGENRANQIDKMAQALKKDLDPDAARSGNFGQISARYQSGQRMKTLINAFDGGNLPPQQMEELALGMANMIAGSSGTARSQVEALVPSSAMRDAQSFKQWLMNEPMGANQQKFVQMMGHTVDREMNLANEQLNTIRRKRLSAHERFRKTAPDQYANMVGEYGMNPDGTPIQSAPANVQPHPQDSVAVAWAKANPKDPRAAKILQLNGGAP